MFLFCAMVACVCLQRQECYSSGSSFYENVQAPSQISNREMQFLCADYVDLDVFWNPCEGTTLHGAHLGAVLISMLLATTANCENMHMWEYCLPSVNTVLTVRDPSTDQICACLFICLVYM